MVIVVVLSVANPGNVTFSLGRSAGDRLDGTAPFFVFLFAALAQGCSSAAWHGLWGRWRRAARAEQATADRLRHQVGNCAPVSRRSSASQTYPRAACFDISRRPRRGERRAARFISASDVNRLLTTASWSALAEACRRGVGAAPAPSHDSARTSTRRCS